ncbi:MlaC/ttg2D family ABC transporter substrate-binding protein [Marinimicrobium alkaliphilum]|uniref:MlaC/ttg2D family ABC transporter substrate-binding protein n=1 Tax=Marinimicrobium alkaliphilum TaxID=2202654 RepID=UPI000DBA2030|nr:ABC transporter substrate-binding protein [Marinimicrobium alkaliphilum]
MFRQIVLPSALLAVLALFGAVAQADTAESEPHAVVEQVTETIMEKVQAYARGDLSGQAYEQAISEALEPVVDFPFIARVVMGNHGEGASEEQIRTFAEEFKRGLVTTYSRGLASYASSTIRLRGPNESTEGKNRVSVHQEVRDGSESHRLSYTMMRNRAGEWKVTNVILDGVNLGQSFRSQFNQSMRQYGNDIDKVIANWIDDADDI